MRDEWQNSVKIESRLSVHATSRDAVSEAIRGDFAGLACRSNSQFKVDMPAIRSYAGGSNANSEGISMAKARKEISAEARNSVSLAGECLVPGDKSISHRSLILGALSVGETRISGLLEGDDVMRTGEAMRELGAEVERLDNGEWRVHGFGTGGFAEPSNVLDFGNSGTGVRLAMGAVSTAPVKAIFTGDESLRSRPMQRIIRPLSEFGASCIGRTGGRLPIMVVGAESPVPVHFESGVASAQVKSAVLLAGLNAPGRTRYIERTPTRDHTERMLSAFGADIEIDESGGVREISLGGYAELAPQNIGVPRDPSSAAFPVAAALICEGSEICVPGICVNPTRSGFFTTLTDMGACLKFKNERVEGGEPVADLHASFSSLSGIDVPPSRAASMIDEFPVLSVVAAFAEGTTTMNGIGELRFKETDRISAMARGLEACGIDVEEGKDSLTVHGKGVGEVPGGACCRTHFDHRIAMSFLCLGLAARNPVRIDDNSAISTSFPGFVDLMRGLGATILAGSES